MDFNSFFSDIPPVEQDKLQRMVSDLNRQIPTSNQEVGELWHDLITGVINISAFFKGINSHIRSLTNDLAMLVEPRV